MRLLSMPGAQGAATAGSEPPVATPSPEGQPKVHRARKTMSKPGNGQVRFVRERCGGGETKIIHYEPLVVFFFKNDLARDLSSSILGSTYLLGGHCVSNSGLGLI